jgi:hypothetical protein
MRGIAASLLVIAAGGCSTLGPVPATTAISPIPAPREGGEVQLAAVPGYFMSQTVTEEPKGGGLTGLSVAIDPAKLLGAPGVVVAARLIGPEEDTQLEPIVGYRRSFGGGLGASVAGFVFGASGRGEVDGASAKTSRLGSEVSADLRIGPASRWAEAHLLAGVSLQYVKASGTYCTEETMQYGRDCPDVIVTQIDGSAKGAYPAATVGVAGHFGRHRASVFHGGRVFAMLTIGAMPTVVGGVQESATGYLAIGLGVSLAFGAK